MHFDPPVEPILSEEELRALRGAIAPQAGPVRREPLQLQPVPVALIADDKAGENARPAAIRLGTRWAAMARQRLSHALGVKIGVEYGGVETMHAPMLKEELAISWSSIGEVVGRAGIVTVTCGGRLVEWTAAQLLGGGEDDGMSPTDRPPSITALHIFSRAGEVVAQSLVDAWREDQNARMSVVHDEARITAFRFELAEAEPMMVLTLNVTTPVSGVIRLIARPETMVPPPPSVRATTLSDEKIEAVLGEVPIEIRVELGRARIKMSELRGLKPGSVIKLGQPTDALLPVECAGVVKALGKPAVSRGALAIEVVCPPPGNKPGSKKP